jgi:hypothetical protein
MKLSSIEEFKPILNGLAWVFMCGIIGFTGFIVWNLYEFAVWIGDFTFFMVR